MKLTTRFGVLVFAVLSVIGAACYKHGEPVAEPTYTYDASLSGVSRAPIRGATFIEAGVDSGIIGDASGLLTFQLVTPLAARYADEQPVTAIEVRGIYMDLVQGTVTATIGSIGGVPQQTHNIVINLPPATETSFVNSLKNQIATQLGVTFQ